VKALQPPAQNQGPIPLEQLWDPESSPHTRWALPVPNSRFRPLSPAGVCGSRPPSPPSGREPLQQRGIPPTPRGAAGIGLACGAADSHWLMGPPVTPS
jgi:hypothetical protein